MQLAQVIQLPHPDGGMWNGPKVAAWMSQLLERPIHPQRGWEYLQGLGMRLKRPRPEHQEKDPEEKEAWKKKLQMEVGKLREEHPEAEIQIWAEDEHRIGLHPVNRRVWVAKGEQPIAQVNFKYQWFIK